MTESIPPAQPVLRLWLVRHGQTLFNVLGMAQGWCDSPLTADGIQGCEALAGELKDMAWAGVYSSPSERAMDTAEIITGAPERIVRDRRWKEYNFGVYEGSKNEDVFTALAALRGTGENPFESARGIFQGDHPALESGETGAEYQNRVREAIADLRTAHAAGGDVIVVSHGMTIGVAATLADPDFDFGHGMGNATFTVLEYAADGAARIIAYGASSPSELRAAAV